jgi:hypothetical protein
MNTQLADSRCAAEQIISWPLSLKKQTTEAALKALDVQVIAQEARVTV